MQPTLASGEGRGGQFVAAAEERLANALEFRPFHGTLNLEGATVDEYRAQLLEEVGDDYCDGVRLRDCRVGGVRAAVLRPMVPDYPAGKTEVVAPVRLRTLFGLEGGDPVPLGPPDEVWAPAPLRAAGPSLDLFDGVVFDLDGTLVDLAVDWSAVRADIEAGIGESLERSVAEYAPRGLYRAARDGGVYEELCEILAEHEHAGAMRATKRDLLDVLGELSCPIGVCTANACEAADLALEAFGVREAVDAVIGRTSVPEHKPHPAPLLACLAELDVRPGNAVFVGDLEGDAEAGSRAGTSFLAAEQVEMR